LSNGTVRNPCHDPSVPGKKKKYFWTIRGEFRESIKVSNLVKINYSIEPQPSIMRDSSQKIIAVFFKREEMICSITTPVEVCLDTRVRQQYI